ncbi:MAG: hypothetical protein K2Q12_10385, partial [Rickettsiales bacterium]|nr:hypothetical protein [Rickettsiales bacterium]
MRTLPNPQTLRMRFFALILSFMLLVPTFATATAESEALIHIERQQWSRLNQVIPRLRDPLIRDIALWYDLANNQQMDDFSQYSAFLQRHPDWPLQEKLLLRAELTLLNGYNSEQTILAWLAAHPPKTARGIFYVEERKSKNKPTASAIKNAWIQADFTELDEKRFLVNYRAQLSTADHIARTDRLLWEGQLNAASRMLLRIPKDEETMFQARIALMKRKGNFDALLARVPARLKNSPGLLYERMRFRFDKEIYDGVTQLLLLAPASPPYPAKWWPYRRYMVREELDRHNYKLAFQLAEKHGQKDKIELSEALWLKAWIELVYLNRPKPAQQDFARMYDVVEFPVSKSRAAYWVARSARANGDGKGFRYWMQIAAQHPTTFYGQI